MREMDTLWGSKREEPWPRRLPSARAHMRADTPDVRCTTPPPA